MNETIWVNLSVNVSQAVPYAALRDIDILRDYCGQFGTVPVVVASGLLLMAVGLVIVRLRKKVAPSPMLEKVEHHLRENLEFLAVVCALYVFLMGVWP